ncbi:hypothetical protein Deba_2673 [Desulfarculus baarsii DSM 2075]|uniref:Uncharacterized protein n=1 Tax=Desulfarculus baarsii (strain ATCC 33931 / DSM 2075 / LMG 7858 / VKM B-1802 / 2st14) TaxID=644282 RepID=E1QKD4_DESB2|nr:hypothetical protein [Desulfarculus baarsii]ADK86027.1 hypothetical protein Deba_2673 [Desulfarculus baarsii DSM 2075]
MGVFRAGVLILAAICLLQPGQAVWAKGEPLFQEVVIRVLDGDGMPLEGAQIVITPMRGQAEKQPPYVTDIDGELRLRWLPETTKRKVTAHGGDVVTTMATRLRYVVTAQGFLPGGGEIDEVNQGRQVADEDVLKLSRPARLLPAMQDVQLRGVDSILPPEIVSRPKDDPLRAGLRRFFDKYQRVAPLMGCDMAAPSFGFADGRLSVIMRWRRPAWIGLDVAPVEGQVLASAALPMAVAMGEDLAALPEVRMLVLVILDEAPAENDPHAMPRVRRLVIEAAPQDYRAFADGRLGGVAFLLAHRPTARLD